LNAFLVGCQEVGQDRPATQSQQDTGREIAESDGLSPEPTPPSTEPEEAPAAAESDDPSADRKEESSAVAVAPTPASEDVAVDLDEALKEVAQLEQDTEYFAALTRVRELMKTHRDGEEGQQLRALHQRLYRDYRTSSELDFAVRKLGEESNAAVSVATGKLLEAGEVGLVFLRKALREAEPTTALRAADVLVQHGEPQIAQLIVERMEQDPPAPLGDELGELLQRLDEIGPEWMERLGALAKGENPSQAGAVSVLIDRLERSVHEQLGVDNADDTTPGAAEQDEPAPSEIAPVKVNEHLVQTLYVVAETAEGPVQRRCVEALVLVLDDVNRHDGKAFNQLLEDEGAHALVGNYVRGFIAERLEAEELPVRLWAAQHAESFSLLRTGLEGSFFDRDFKNRLFDRVDTRLQFEPDQFGYPDERHDNFSIRWLGLIEVPADGDYVFSCETDGTCSLWLDDQPILRNSKKPGPVELTAGLHEIRIEYVEKTGPDKLAIYWQTPEDEQPQTLADELQHVDRVQLLVDKLIDQPDAPQAPAWLVELSYKADRLTAETIAELIKLAGERESWQGPLSRVAAAAILCAPRESPDPAVSLLAESAPTLKGDVRRRAVEALATYFSAACGSDRQKFDQAAASGDTYDFLCEEIQSIADSAEAADTEWALEQAKHLGLKISTVVRQGKDGRAVLHAQVATLHGNSIKYEFGNGKDNLGYWTNAEDFASWRLVIANGGTFAVSLTWACEDGNEGGEFVVAVADQQLIGKVATTGDWAEFQTMNLGTMKLGSGTHELTVKAKAKPKSALMNLQSLTLESRK
jgi:hypothetical protein